MAALVRAACMLLIIAATCGASRRELQTFNQIHDAVQTVVDAKLDAVQDLFDKKVVVVHPPPPAPPAPVASFAAAQASASASASTTPPPPPPPQPTSASASASASASTTTNPPSKAPAPTPCKTVYQTAQSVPELSTLVALVQAAGLVSELNDPSLVATVFAPTNAAINAAINALGVSQSALLTNGDLLRQILTTHIVLGSALLSTDLKDNQVLRAQSGASLTIDLGATVTVKAPGSSAKVVQANVQACAAVVHVIDFVLLPTAPPAPPKVAPKVAPAPAPKAATPPTTAIARAGAEAVVAG